FLFITTLLKLLDTGLCANLRLDLPLWLVPRQFGFYAKRYPRVKQTRAWISRRQNADAHSPGAWARLYPIPIPLATTACRYESIVLCWWSASSHSTVGRAHRRGDR